LTWRVKLGRQWRQGASTMLRGIGWLTSNVVQPERVMSERVGPVAVVFGRWYLDSGFYSGCSSKNWPPYARDQPEHQPPPAPRASSACRPAIAPRAAAGANEDRRQIKTCKLAGLAFLIAVPIMGGHRACGALLSKPRKTLAVSPDRFY
jgi:hypothetical protein